MNFNDLKITGYADSIKNLPDTIEGRAAWLKSMFDSRTDNEIQSSINAICQRLSDSHISGIWFNTSNNPPPDDNYTIWIKTDIQSVDPRKTLETLLTLYNELIEELPQLKADCESALESRTITEKLKNETNTIKTETQKILDNAERLAEHITPKPTIDIRPTENRVLKYIANQPLRMFKIYGKSIQGNDDSIPSMYSGITSTSSYVGHPAPTNPVEITPSRHVEMVIRGTNLIDINAPSHVDSGISYTVDSSTNTLIVNWTTANTGVTYDLPDVAGLEIRIQHAYSGSSANPIQVSYNTPEGKKEISKFFFTVKIPSNATDVKVKFLGAEAATCPTGSEYYGLAVTANTWDNHHSRAYIPPTVVSFDTPTDVIFRGAGGGSACDTLTVFPDRGYGYILRRIKEVSLAGLPVEDDTATRSWAIDVSSQNVTLEEDGFIMSTHFWRAAAMLLKIPQNRKDGIVLSKGKLYFSKLNFTTAQDLTSFLSAQNVKVFCKMAKPESESLTAQQAQSILDNLWTPNSEMITYSNHSLFRIDFTYTYDLESYLNKEVYLW